MTAAGYRWSTVKPCGTPAAYRRHVRRGEQPCRACKDAENARQRGGGRLGVPLDWDGQPSYEMAREARAETEIPRPRPSQQRQRDAERDRQIEARLAQLGLRLPPCGMWGHRSDSCKCDQPGDAS